MQVNTLNHWWLVALKGLAILTLGLIAMAKPIEMTEAVVFTSAVFIGFGGVSLLLFGLMNPRHYMQWWFILEGGVDIVVALLIFLNPYLTITVLTIIFSLWLFINSLFRLHVAYRRRSMDQQWKVTFTNGMLTLLFSIVFMVHPEAGVISFGMLLGIILASYGVFLLGVSLKWWRDEV